MMIKNPILKNTLSALAILVFSPILLILVFLFYALIYNFYEKIHWTPNAGPITGIVILAVLSWFIFRSKLATLYKAIYTTVPVAIVLAVILIYCGERSSVLGYSLGAVFLLGVLAYLFLTKKSWLYYFSVILISIALLVMGLLGVEI